MFPYNLFHFPRSYGLIIIDQSYISFQRTLRRVSFLSRVIDAVMYCTDLGIQITYQQITYNLSIKNYKYDMENRYRKLFASMSKVRVSWYLCKL